MAFARVYINIYGLNNSIIKKYKEIIVKKIL